MSLLDNSNKQLLKNFTSLGFLQTTNYLIPLILVPYLIRSIGLEQFGLTSFAQAIMAYFVVLVDYSFTITATKKISVNKNDKNEIGRVVSNVYAVKLLLAIFCFLILLVMTVLIPKLSAEKVLYLSGFSIVVGQMLFPNWLFQGLENMKFLPILNVAGRLSTLIFVFVFIQVPEDYLLVLPSYAIGNIISGILGIFLILFHFKIPIKVASLANIKLEFKEGFTLFISSFFSSLSGNAGIIILGFFTNNLILGYYSTAEKLINVIKQVLISFYLATYPRICELALGSFEEIKSLIRKVYLPFYAVLILGLTISAFLSDEIIFLITGEMIDQSSNLFLIMLLSPLFAALNIAPNQILLAFNYNKLYSFVLVSGSIISIVLQLVFVPYYLAEATAVILVVTDFYVMISFYLITIAKNPDLSLIPINRSK